MYALLISLATRYVLIWFQADISCLAEVGEELEEVSKEKTNETKKEEKGKGKEETKAAAAEKVKVKENEKAKSKEKASAKKEEEEPVERYVYILLGWGSLFNYFYNFFCIYSSVPFNLLHICNKERLGM